MFVDQVVQRNARTFGAKLVDEVFQSAGANDVGDLARCKHQIRSFCAASVFTISARVGTNSGVFRVDSCQFACDHFDRLVFFVDRVAFVVHLNRQFQRLVNNPKMPISQRRSSQPRRQQKNRSDSKITQKFPPFMQFSWLFFAPQRDAFVEVFL